MDLEPRVPVFSDEDSYVVCSLIPEKVCALHSHQVEQVSLNLQISEEEEVGLSVSGNEPVDIIGNYLLPAALNNIDPEDFDYEDLKDLEDDEDDDDEDEDDEDDEDDEGDGPLLLEAGEADDDDEDDDDEDDEDEDDNDDEDGVLIEEVDEEDDDEDDDDEEDEDEEDDDEEIVVVPSKKRPASELDNDSVLVEEGKLSRGQRKRLNKKLKAEAAAAGGAQPRDNKVRDVLASVLTDALFGL